MAEPEPAIEEESPLPLMYETGPLAPHAGPSDTVSDAPMFVPAPKPQPGVPVAGQVEEIQPLPPELVKDVGDQPAVREPGFEHDKQGKSMENTLVDEIKASGDRVQAIYDDYKRTKNPYYKEILEALRMRGQVQMPPLEPLPQPPNFQNELRSSRQNMMSVGALWLAIGLGARGRGGMTTALSAYTGIMRGIQQGNKDAAEQEMERYKAAMDYTIKYNKQLTDQYKQVIEAQNMDLDSKFLALQTIAAAEKDDIGGELARQKNLADIAAVVKKNEHLRDQARLAELQVRKLEQGIRLADQKANPKPQATTMSDADLNELVDEYHNTGRRPQLSVFGFRAAGDANRRAFQELLTERIKSENWGPDWQRKAAADWTGEMAGARTGGTRAANLDILLRKAEAAIPLAEQASRNVPRGSLVALNALQLRGKEAISDPNVRIFAIQNLAVAEGWAAAMNPTGVMRESDRALALDNLKLSESQGTYSAALKAVDGYIKRERKAVQGFREHTPVEEGTPAATPPQTLGGQPPRINAPPDAIEFLKKHPDTRKAFDSKYGDVKNPNPSNAILGP